MSRFDGFARRYLPVRGPRRREGRRGRFGFWGPVPHYSTRTRRGSEVSVGGCGCCLPIPLIAVLATAAGLRAVWRRLR
ncbi:hypothetical protein ACU61A_09480 [Pseudonocardia sichuanensis]